MRALLISLALSGCASFNPPPMVKAAAPHSVTIEWKRQAPQTCGGSPSPLGCAYMSKDWTTCRIEMAEGAPDFIIAHEFRHCFGWVHPSGGR